MIKIYDKYELSDIFNRSFISYEKEEAAVRSILSAVREEGDAALKRFSAQFDKAEVKELRVTKEEIASSLPRVGTLLGVIKRAAENIKEYHAKQLRSGYEYERDGVTLGEKITPISRVGVYVPGGTASYPSTVLMDVIPAIIAGVKEIAIATPPDKNGNVSDGILAAASVLGITEVYKMGGAQAIGAFAYGTDSVKRVDKIVGPGNIYVALAKKQVYGTVGIDMIAGPSEILIIADSSAVPEYVAADLLSQAEHDAYASAVLVTDDVSLSSKVQVEIERQLALLPRREIAEKSINANGKIILTENIDKAVEISNLIAPEHLELCVSSPYEILKKIENAGSVFLGNFTPEPIGDYYAGANHTLPTGGSARFASPLGVDDFIKKTQYIRYGERELLSSALDVIAFAKSEGLDAHANAVSIRKKK